MKQKMQAGTAQTCSRSTKTGGHGAVRAPDTLKTQAAMDLSASTIHLGSWTSTTRAALSLRCSWDPGTRHASKRFHYFTRKKISHLH